MTPNYVNCLYSNLFTLKSSAYKTIVNSHETFFHFLRPPPPPNHVHTSDSHFTGQRLRFLTAMSTVLFNITINKNLFYPPPTTP